MRTRIPHSSGILVLALILGLCPAMPAGAQITLTTDYFPVAGDTLNTLTDGLPNNISITAAGPDQTWDFTSLQAPFLRRIPVLPAAEGAGFASFPDADHMQPLDDGLEGYYRVGDGEYLLLGFYGTDPLDLGIEAAIPLDIPLPQRRAPLRYLDRHEAETSISVSIAIDELPEEVLGELPFTPDSLRLRGSLEQEDHVDAWGMIRIPGGTYEVLRERREEARDIRLDAKIDPLDWVDITELLPANDLLGPVRTVSHFYFSNEAKEPIAQVLLDDTESRALQVIFKALDTSTAVERMSKKKPEVYAYPNPAIGDVRFAFSGIPAGAYTLSIFNILGIEKWKGSFRIDGNHTEKVNIASLSKGSYLYSLANDQGKILATKRLIVIKP